MIEIKNAHVDWGSLEVDQNGKILRATETFLEHFHLVEKEVIDQPLAKIVKRVSPKKFAYAPNKDVVFGTINSHPCLIKILKHDKKRHQLSVIFKYSEVYRHELLGLLNYVEQQKQKHPSTTNRSNQLYTFDQIIGVSRAMKQVKELAARVARGNSTVLITGESGTGKELFAQAIHNLSTRREGPFVPINCAAIPENLFESELFGYESGAFSGAKKEGKPGKIELAQNGTLFLDEISELPLNVQGKLLRVLQEREVERLGSVGRRKVDIRVIAATNRDLKYLVQDGKFRQDLYYRLLVFELKIPPLRDRREDILHLAYQFLIDYNREFGLDVKDFDEKLVDWMLKYDWPGNVRELKSFIERGMNIVEGKTLTLDDFFIGTSNFASVFEEETKKEIRSLEDELAQTEKQTIERALLECGGDKTLAAKKLNIHLASLYRKIAKYHIEV